MNAPTNPATNPFGACLRIASLSASVFPRAAIHALPNTGPAYQMPPITKLRIVDVITAMKKLPSNMIAISLPLEGEVPGGDITSQQRSWTAFPSLGRSTHRVRGLRSFPPPQGRTWTPPELGTEPGAGVVRGAGVGALASVVVGALGAFARRSRITGVYGSTSPPAKPISPRRITSDSCKPPPM